MHSPTNYRLSSADSSPPQTITLKGIQHYKLALKVTQHYKIHWLGNTDTWVLLRKTKNETQSRGQQLAKCLEKGTHCDSDTEHFCFKSSEMWSVGYALCCSILGRGCVVGHRMYINKKGLFSLISKFPKLIFCQLREQWHPCRYITILQTPKTNTQHLQLSALIKTDC